MLMNFTQQLSYRDSAFIQGNLHIFSPSTYATALEACHMPSMGISIEMSL